MFEKSYRLYISTSRIFDLAGREKRHDFRAVVGKDTFFLYLDKIHILCQIKYLDTIQILFWPMYLDKIQIQILIHGLLKLIHLRYISMARYYFEIQFYECIIEEVLA